MSAFNIVDFTDLTWFFFWKEGLQPNDTKLLFLPAQYSWIFIWNVFCLPNIFGYSFVEVSVNEYLSTSTKIWAHAKHSGKRLDIRVLMAAENNEYLLETIQ